MKKLLTFAVIVTMSFSAQAQDLGLETEIYLGEIRQNGLTLVTKAAYWSTRPEAKSVYNGGFPEGVTVYRLSKPYFARFIPGENNTLDRNYIVLPAGTLVYEKNGKWFLAYCGNQLEYLKPVNQVTVIKVEVPTICCPPAPPTPKEEKPAVVENPPSNLTYRPYSVDQEKSTITPFDKKDLQIPASPKEEVKKKNLTWLWVGLGTAAAGTATYLILDSKKDKYDYYGRPGGAPITPGRAIELKTQSGFVLANTASIAPSFDLGPSLLGGLGKTGSYTPNQEKYKVTLHIPINQLKKLKLKRA